MKVAILHDWLNQKVGGAEAVLFQLAEMYPGADIYTIIYNPKKFDKYLSDRKIKTSKLQKLPNFFKKRPKLLLPFVKNAVESFDLSGYDLIISSSSAWVKNANIPSEARHVCYCYSPARMLWDSWPKYVDEIKIGPVLKFYIIKLASQLRIWDYYKSQEGTEFIAISNHVSGRIRKFYRLDSLVIYPPVNLKPFINPTKEYTKKDYYLIVSILAKYKNIELAIKAFKDSGKNLVIAGDGPDLKRLKEIAADHENIVFLGRVSDNHKTRLMREAKGFIFTNVEDFGITMVESIASGTGVIALSGGGANEIIKDGKTGVFYKEPNEEYLNRAIVKYEKTILSGGRFNNDYISKKFSENVFMEKFQEVINAK